MCCFSEGRQLSVLLHGGETIVMCCYSEGRQLSWVVTGKGDSNCNLVLH